MQEPSGRERLPALKHDHALQKTHRESMEGPEREAIEKEE